MVTPNQVLAYGVLVGLGVVVGWTLWRNTRQLADVTVRSVRRVDDGVEVGVGIGNGSETTVALESVEVTKAKDGPEVKRWVVEVDDDVRLPVEGGGTLEGWVRLKCVGRPVPEAARVRLLFIFRSPGGAEMAETWVDLAA